VKSEALLIVLKQFYFIQSALWAACGQHVICFK